MPQKHEHEDFYNQRIKQKVGQIWVQIKYYFIGLAGLIAVGLVSHWLGWWPITILIGFLLLCYFLFFGGVLLISPTIWQPLSMIVSLHRQKRIALQHSAIVTQTIWNAHASVQDQLANWSEKKFSTRVFRKMLRIYQELDRLSTPELEKLREEAGLTNPYGHAFPFGKTLRESLISTIYAGRLSEENAKQQATAEALKRSETYAKAAPSLQRRKERELEREGLQLELEEYAGTSTRTTFELERLQGECALTHQDGAVTAARIRIDESGEFEIYRRDGEHRQRLRSISGGKAISFEFLPPAESGWLEIVRTADGEIEPIPLP